MSLHECGTRDAEAVEEALGGAVRDAFELMPADARARVRARLGAATGLERRPFMARFGRPLIAAAVGFSLVGGVSAAAATSQPGDVFYPVKRSAAALAVSVRRPSAQPTLTPISQPAQTPAAAVDAATDGGRKAPAGSVRGGAVPSGQRIAPTGGWAKPGKKASPAKGKGAPSKGKGGSRTRGPRTTSKSNGRH